MKKIKQAAILVLLYLLILLIVWRSAKASLLKCWHGWKENPVRMVAKLITSAIMGQGLFWHFGYDQLGVFMNTKWQIGYGQTLAERVSALIPNSPTAAWIIKVLEILGDFSKIPFEGALYRRHGITPDVVASIIPQPLWSIGEVVEKTGGAAFHPDEVTKAENVKVSIGCIYGTLFRLGLALLYWYIGDVINKILSDPLERLMRKYLPLPVG